MPYSLQKLSERLKHTAQQLRLKLSYEEQIELLVTIFQSENLFFSHDELCGLLDDSNESDPISIDVDLASLMEKAIWIYGNHHLLNALDQCTESNIKIETKKLTDVSILKQENEHQLCLEFEHAKMLWSYDSLNLPDLEQTLLTLGLGPSIPKAQQLLTSYYKRLVVGKPITLLYYRTLKNHSEQFIPFKQLHTDKYNLIKAFKEAIQNQLLHDFFPHGSDIFFEELLSSEEDFLKIRLNRSTLEVYRYEEGSVVVRNNKGGLREIIASLTDNGLFWNEPVQDKETILHKLGLLCDDRAARPKKPSRIHNGHSKKRA